jgi:tetrahydromethanopterin S-methyltransferase subunit G
MSYAMLMAVMVPREKWTDERLDDLNKKVDNGFRGVGARFDHLEARFEAQMDKQFGELNQRFDRMQFTLIGSAVTIIAALIGLIATQL